MGDGATRRSLASAINTIRLTSDALYNQKQIMTALPQAPRTRNSVRLILLVWLFLMFPWAYYAMMSPLFFSTGSTAEDHQFFWKLWTYPVAVAAAILLRRRAPILVVLPATSMYFIMKTLHWF